MMQKLAWDLCHGNGTILVAGQHCRAGMMLILPSKEKVWATRSRRCSSILFAENSFLCNYAMLKSCSKMLTLTCEISNMESSTVPHMEELISYSQKCAETWPWFIQMRESCPDVLRNEVRPFSCGRKQGVFRWLLARWIQCWLHKPI